MISLLVLISAICPAPFAAEAAQRVLADRPTATFQIECEDDDTAHLVTAQKQRDVSLRDVAPKQRGRTVALALLELLDAPAPVASAPVVAAKPRLTLQTDEAPLTQPNTAQPWSTQGAAIVEKNAVRLNVANSFYRNDRLPFTGFIHEVEARYFRNVHPIVDVSFGGAFSIGFINVGGTPLIAGARVRAFANDTFALAAELQVRPVVVDVRFVQTAQVWGDISSLAHLSFFPRRNVTVDLSPFVDVRLPYFLAGSFFHVVAPGARFGVSYLGKSAGVFANIEAQGYVNMQSAFVMAQVPYFAFREVRVGFSLGAQWKR